MILPPDPSGCCCVLQSAIGEEADAGVAARSSSRRGLGRSWPLLADSNTAAEIAKPTAQPNRSSRKAERAHESRFRRGACAASSEGTNRARVRLIKLISRHHACRAERPAWSLAGAPPQMAGGGRAAHAEPSPRFGGARAHARTRVLRPPPGSSAAPLYPALAHTRHIRVSLAQRYSEALFEAARLARTAGLGKPGTLRLRRHGASAAAARSGRAGLACHF